MSELQSLREALRLLFAQPLRSLLTLFGLVWGTAAVTLTIGFLCFLGMEERPLRGR